MIQEGRVLNVGRTRMRSAANRTGEIYDTLRRAIVMGELRPNEPLIEVEIALQFCVSRTPVRECLQRLSAAGLVVPRKRGWAVREFAESHVLERAEIRAALEGYATFLAAARASQEALDGIVRIHAERLTLGANDEARRVETNRAFHDAILAACGNASLADAVYGLGQFYFSGSTARRATARDLELGNKDHERIVEALIRRDREEAERAMRAHIYRTFQVYTVLERP